MKWWLPPTLKDYKRSSLSADLLAGLTLLAVALPSQMATAHLAGLPVSYGLYAFVGAAIAYTILGTNKHLVVGADSTIAPVLATGVAAVAVAGPQRLEVMAFAAILVGCVLVAVGLLRLGWVSQLLSTPVVTGVLAGIAVSIAIRQVPVVLGLAGGGTTTIGRVQQIAHQVSHLNGWTLGIALGVLVVIAVGQSIDHRVPGAFIGLVLSMSLATVFHLQRHGVALLGTVHGGLPHFGWPAVTWSQAQRLGGIVFTVAFLCVAQTAATIRASNVTAEPNDDFNRDLIGVGAGSLVAGFSGTLAVDASPPTTALAIAAGGRSQLTNCFAAAGVVVVVLLATAPLSHLPEATLGATLLFVATRLFKVKDLQRIWTFDRLEFALAAVTLVAVAVAGIEQGVALAMVLSLADRTRRAARPHDALLGRASGTDHWIPTDIGYETEHEGGVLVYLVYAPLWYGNADYLRVRILRLIESAPEPVKLLVIDASAMADIDYTGLQALAALLAELKTHKISIAIARSSHLLHHDLKHGALLKQIGPEHLYTSVEEAATALKPVT